MPRFKATAVFECQPGVFYRPTDEYVYVGIDRLSGLHIFKSGDKRELFARTREPSAGWHLKHGGWSFEFCRSEARAND